MKDIIDKYTSTEFEYGIADCCQFAGEVIERQTGRNPCREFDYSSRAEAYEIIASYGSIEALLDAKIGPGIQGVYDPNDGDIGLCKTETGFELVGVVYAGRIVVLTQNGGVMGWPLSKVYKVWVVACRKQR